MILYSAVVRFSPPEPLALNLRDLWQLKAGIAFLNHGSFGAVPRKVAEFADIWRRRIEAEPIEMLGRRWPELIAEAKRPVSAFLNANPDCLGFVTNATEGVNCVLRSLSRTPDDRRDELVTTTHVYHAVRQAMKFVAKQLGLGYREIDIPLPVESADSIAQTVIKGLSDRTRLLVLDHVTSPTALLFPVEQIATACRDQGIDFLVDGAHAPGMVPIDLAQLAEVGVTYYTGNLHKWCCAPKGTAFLWVTRDRTADIHPVVISHWYGEGLTAEFHWQGTRDHASWLSAGTALDFLSQFGWEKIRLHNRDLARWAFEMLNNRLGTEPISPTDCSLLGSMATVRLPKPFAKLDESAFKIAQQNLYDRFAVELPLIRFGKDRLFRVSCQIYNTASDYERAAEAIEALASEI